VAAFSSGTGLEVSDGFNINIKYNSQTQLVDFTFVVPDGTYMGIILGSKKMANSDMIQVVADGGESYF
jgi:hypothetical protein